MKKNPLEALFDVIYGLMKNNKVESEKIDWEMLDEGSKKLLDEAMNKGITRSEAKYTVCKLTGKYVCLAEYHDKKEDFNAFYLLFGSEVIYANEF